MKTKQILSILAVPALLAACTAENDLLVNNAPELAGRKVLDPEMTIGFVGADQLDSRLSMGAESITLDSSDKIAASLMDRVLVGEEDEESVGYANGYMITDGISTNHPFTMEGSGKWSTPTQLVEGNYLFYYQYNEALARNREEAVPYTIAKNQFAYSKDAPTVFVGDQAIKDNVMGIGYAWLGADLTTGYTPKNVNVQMYSLFSFLKLNISTTDKTNLQVQQIKITPLRSDKFKLSGKIDNAKVAARGIETADGLTATDDNPANAGALIRKNESVYTSNYATETGTLTDYIILSLPDLAVNSTPQSVYVVVPADDYESDIETPASSGEYPEFEILVYTNQGVFTRIVELSEVGDPIVDYSKLVMGEEQPVGLKIEGTLTAADTYFVGSVAEWRKVLNSLPASTTEENVTIELLADVSLTKADVDLLQSSNAKDYNMTISGENMVLTESCALNDITIEKVSVNTGVEVDLNGNTVIATLTNNGTVNVNAVEETTPVTNVAEITTLTNIGTVTVNATSAEATAITNTGIVNFEVASTITSLVNGSNAAQADNSAVEFNVNAGKLIAGVTTNYTGASISVDADAEFRANGTNAGTIEVDGKLMTNGAFINTGSINANENSVVTNLATAITNSGTIEAATGADITVGNNTSGTITYNDGASVAVNGTGAQRGKIAYVITEDYVTPASAVEYNTIVIDGLNIKLQAAGNADPSLVVNGITNIVIKGNSIVDASGVDEELTLIEVQSGKSQIITAAATVSVSPEIEITAGGLTTASLNVAAGAWLTIPLNSAIKVTGALTNNGTINVGGALTRGSDVAGTAGEIAGSGAY